jgi:bacteriocin-like protein
MINSEDELPQQEIDVLTDAELEAISGGGISSFLHRVFGGPGDLRRSTDRPNQGGLV